MPQPDSSLLLEAHALIHGERAAQHGDAGENHACIAAFWNAWLQTRREPAAPLGAWDCLMMMVLLKVARTQRGAFNADDYRDMAGYLDWASRYDPMRPGA